MVHRCPNINKLLANLLTSYNKISPANLDILRLETQAQLFAASRVSYFSNLLKVDKEKVFFIGDNIASLTLILSFEKNFMHLKPFFLRNIKKLLSYGFSTENFLYTPSQLNISDCLTRLESISPGNIATFLRLFLTKRNCLLIDYPHCLEFLT